MTHPDNFKDDLITILMTFVRAVVHEKVSVMKGYEFLCKFGEFRKQWEDDEKSNDDERLVLAKLEVLHAEFDAWCKQQGISRELTDSPFLMSAYDLWDWAADNTQHDDPRRIWLEDYCARLEAAEEELLAT